MSCLSFKLCIKCFLDNVLLLSMITDICSTLDELRISYDITIVLFLSYGPLHCSLLGDPVGARLKRGSGYVYGFGIWLDSPFRPLRLEYASNDGRAKRFHLGVFFLNRAEIISPSIHLTSQFGWFNQQLHNKFPSKHLLAIESVALLFTDQKNHGRDLQG